MRPAHADNQVVECSGEVCPLRGPPGADGTLKLVCLFEEDRHVMTAKGNILEYIGGVEVAWVQNLFCLDCRYVAERTLQSLTS